MLRWLNDGNVIWNVGEDEYHVTLQYIQIIIIEKKREQKLEYYMDNAMNIK